METKIHPLNDRFVVRTWRSLAGYRAYLMTNDSGSRCALWEDFSCGDYRYCVATTVRGSWYANELEAVKGLRKRVVSEIRRLEKNADRDPSKDVRLAFLRGWE